MNDVDKQMGLRQLHAYQTRSMSNMDKRLGWKQWTHSNQVEIRRKEGSKNPNVSKSPDSRRT
jgi:hypothetical protein